MIDTLTDVTFLAAGPSVSVDRYGQPIPGEDVSTVIEGCIVFQTATTEVPQVGADQVVSLLTILVPYGSDVAFTGRALIGDDTDHVYQIVGTPTQYRNPWTSFAPGGVVFVRLVEG